MRSRRNVGHTKYHQSDEIKNDMRERNVAHMGEKVNEYRILMGNSEGKKPLGRHRRSWKDKIEMDLQEIRRESVGRINVDRDMDKQPALMNKAMQSRILQNSEYFGKNCETIGYSSRKLLHGGSFED
jgi:hypothetical protein